MTSMTQTTACRECGAPCTREIPASLKESFRRILESVPPLCQECSQRVEAEASAAERQRAQWELERQADERALRVAIRRQDAGIPLRLRDLSWTDVADTATGPLAAARAWANGELPGLLLAGPVGVGKTWLAATAAWDRLERRSVRWFSVPVLLAALSLSFDDDRQADAVDALIGQGALVLDDLDKARPSQYAAEQLFCAIDSRMNAGDPLLVTTNLGLGELASKFPQPHGEAIASRLAGYCEAFAMQGHDRRVERFAA
jgi:DNA replication protein DnaC